jgi:hypothetical protein
MSLVPFPDFVNDGGAIALDLHRFLVDPVVTMCADRFFFVPVRSSLADG